MNTNDKRALAVFLLLITVIGYYFFVPSRSWLGKSYLKTTQEEGFALVELFTSEGCSSCPPADDLMAKVQKESGDKKIYFLAFHVDYWNHLKWRDRFSSNLYTDRQEQYANWMNRSLIYTPQFVINGMAEFGGDDSRTLYSLISTALGRKPLSTLKLQAKVSENFINVSYKANKDISNTNVYVALVQKEAISHVKRGENSGTVLHHVQIVTEIISVPLDKSQGNIRLPKPEDFNSNNWEVIGFIQSNKSGVISAATKTNF